MATLHHNPDLGPVHQPHRWSPADLADAAAQGLLARAREDDLEQAVYGFDCLDELGLHPLIHRALQTTGYGVWPEQQYPDDWGKTRRSEGKRCDVVVTPRPEQSLRDPMIQGTLFEHTLAIDPQDAYWLEIKSVAQFETAGPFRHYSKELLAPVTADVKKLHDDRVICHAGLLLILFTQDQATADHDLAAWHNRCLEKHHPVAPPASRGFKITDRVGNSYCTAALFPVRGG